MFGFIIKEGLAKENLVTIYRKTTIAKTISANPFRTHTHFTRREHVVK